MTSPIDDPKNANDYSDLSHDQLLAILSERDKKIAKSDTLIAAAKAHIASANATINIHQQSLRNKDLIIELLEEKLRLARARNFASSSEKLSVQVELFDEAEVEVTLSELEAQLAEEEAETAKPKKKTRQRGFSDNLPRKRIELCLSEDEKAGAVKTFFSKVKEELEYIPAQLTVLEIWQEKAVFSNDDASDTVVAAKRPVHPLNKCFASISLLAYIIVSKYADGLPLYRLEGILKRYGNSVDRTNMASWIIRLENQFKPLINLMREVQNTSCYINADETRIQVLKEDGKTIQSNKWMWVTCGGPPDKPSVLFEYDPSRSGAVPERLLVGFDGILQADGYSGYGKICDTNNIQRVGCFDHARRKFVDAIKAADNKKSKSKASKADVAISKIRKLYRIEAQIKGLTDEERYLVRQKHSVPILNEFKDWLEKNLTKVVKGSKTRQAMEYTLNQWDHLVAYCDHGFVEISNAKAENAIRPFAVGRRAWLFADTSRGAKASATCYSLIETAKANGLEPYSYIQYVLENIGEADTLEKLEVLLPWNIPANANLKKIDKTKAANSRG